MGAHASVKTSSQFATSGYRGMLEMKKIKKIKEADEAKRQTNGSSRHLSTRRGLDECFGLPRRWGEPGVRNSLGSVMKPMRE